MDINLRNPSLNVPKSEIAFPKYLFCYCRLKFPQYIFKQEYRFKELVKDTEITTS